MHEPLALEYVAAGVNADHDVKILDMRIDDNLADTLALFRPDVVATTGFTIHFNNSRRILKNAKAFDNNILTVIGGHHATVRPEDFCDNFIDVIVIGEGVFAFREIINKREQGAAIRGIPGTAVVSEGKINFAQHRPYTDLNSLPFPDRAATRKYRHRYFIPSMGNIASIRTSLGCYFRCNYCALWQITKGKYLTRDIDMVVKELAEINEANIFFADDESMLRGQRMIELAEGIKASGIDKKYRIFARSDTVVKMPELIEKWREIGLHSVVIGFEAFTDEDLKKLNKATTVAKNEEAISILKRNDVEVCADFIVTQDFSRAKFRQLAEYVRNLDLKVPVFPILTPLPGTALYDEKKDTLITEDYDLYDFKHTIIPTALPLKTFYDEFAKLHLLMFPLFRRFVYRFFFALTKYLPTFKTGYEIMKSLKKLEKDHESVGREKQNRKGEYGK